MNSDEKTTEPVVADADPELTTAADEKRRLARRKFLFRSTAAGSGLLVVTLCHQRAFAQTNPNIRMVSSEAMCNSLHGIFNNTPQPGSVGGATRYTCTLNG